jgi:hypothetical protein
MMGGAQKKKAEAVRSKAPSKVNQKPAENFDLKKSA